MICVLRGQCKSCSLAKCHCSGQGCWGCRPAYLKTRGADRGPRVAQILVVGKLMQAGMLSWAAYRSEADFRERTGIPHSAFISEPRTGTQVSARVSASGISSYSATRKVLLTAHRCESLSLGPQHSLRVTLPEKIKSCSHPNHRSWGTRYPGLQGLSVSASGCQGFWPRLE